VITGSPPATPAAPAFALAVEERIATAHGSLRDRRQAAWDAFSTMPMPSSQRDEDWRRTDIAKLQLSGFRPSDGIDEPLVNAIRQRRDQGAADAALMIDAAPVTRIEQSDELAAAGVVLSSLDEAARLHPELVERALSAVGVAESPFVALWNAMWSGGAFIYVPRSGTPPCPSGWRTAPPGTAAPRSPRPWSCSRTTRR
jgi:Fe-S cluster assembly scaffold protein SufB